MVGNLDNYFKGEAEKRLREQYAKLYGRAPPTTATCRILRTGEMMVFELENGKLRPTEGLSPVECYNGNLRPEETLSQSLERALTEPGETSEFRGCVPTIRDIL